MATVNPETKNYSIIFSYGQMTELSRASLTDAEFQQMLTIRKEIKQYAGFMVVKDDAADLGTGENAIAAARKLLAELKQRERHTEA